MTGKRATALGLLFWSATAMARWGIPNGGDGMRLAFAHARDHAAMVTMKLQPRSFSAQVPAQVKDWILTNKQALAADILGTEHIWLDEARPTCALTHSDDIGELTNKAPIRFSYPTCHLSITSFAMATELLIHESVHHFGITDETFADQVALAISKAYEGGHTSWLALPAGPQARSGASAVWTGDEAIFFGGQNADDDTIADGWAFDPETVRWRQISASGAPARNGHQAVWTGTHMALWGGFDSQGTRHGWYNSGALYHPKTDSWETLRMPFGPEKTKNRIEGTAAQTLVLADGKLVVFGGATDDYSPVPGGMYDLATKTWTRISTEGAPKVVQGHAAAAAGHLVYVWGGSPSLGRDYVNTGAVLDTRTNTWAPLPQERAPTPRLNHTMIWTGDKLVVFGGYAGGSNYKGTGATFDPATGAWTNFETEIAMDRTGHSAVWTGKEMLVFGGKAKRSSRTYYGAVAGFDPTTLRWRSVEVPATLEARHWQAATWTGASMIVFGGATQRRILRSGGQFYP